MIFVLETHKFGLKAAKIVGSLNFDGVEYIDVKGFAGGIYALMDTSIG